MICADKVKTSIEMDISQSETRQNDISVNVGKLVNYLVKTGWIANQKKHYNVSHGEICTEING